MSKFEINRTGSFCVIQESLDILCLNLFRYFLNYAKTVQPIYLKFQQSIVLRSTTEFQK